jgi:hypothetical protein
VIAELRLAALAQGELIDHVLGDVVLELAVLYSARVAHDVEDLLVLPRDVIGDARELLYETIVVRWQVEWSGQRLKARVAVADRVQRRDAGMGLRMPRRRPRPDVPGMKLVLAGPCCRV